MVSLVTPGQGLTQCMICLHVGEVGLEGIGLVGFGKQLPCVSCGVFGESLMLVALREWSRVWGS